MKFFPAIVLVLLISACTDSEDQVKDLRSDDISDDVGWSSEDTATSDVIEDSTDSDNTTNDVLSSEWSYKVISISENNWGYQIFQKGTMIINQTSIPSIQGIDGFDSEEKAERTAKHILNKVENGTFPPTVNKEELEKLGVLRD